MRRRPVQTPRRNVPFGPNVVTERCDRSQTANMQVGAVGTSRSVERSARAVATSLSPKPFSLSPPPSTLHPSPLSSHPSTRSRAAGGASA